MSCRTNCSKTFLFVLVLLALAILATPAFAGNCLKDVSRANSCTANDVSIAAVQNGSVNVFQGGISGTNKCIAGGTFSFTATFEVKTTSSSTRSNVGIFFGTGQNNATSGTCTDAILAPSHPCAFVNGVATATCGDLNYSEKDGSINGETGPDGTQAGCGDTASGDSSTQFGAGTHAAVLEVDNVTCPSSGTNLPLPVCSSWYQPSNTMPVCSSPAPDYPWVPAAIPGAPSKCVCGVVNVPVQPITLNATVAKSCNTSLSTGAGLTSCDAGPEGADEVTYHVAVTNKTTLGDIIVDSICDNRYGKVFAATGFSCAAGTVGTIDGTGCSALDIAQGATQSCDFTAHQGENASVTDTVEVTYHSAVNNSEGPPADSNPVTVTSSDAPSSASYTKGLDSLQAASVTARFSVDVHNSSAADESVTLSELDDSAYGQIAPTKSASIVTTSCSIPTGGRSIAAGADYTCTFDATIALTSLVPVEEFGTGTCNTQTGFCSAGKSGSTACTKNSDCDLSCQGISHVNSVTGTMTGDEGETVTQTHNTLTTDICPISFTSSSN